MSRAPSDSLLGQWRVAVLVVILANLAAVIAVVVYHWPDPASGFGGRFERNWMSWFTSVQLVLAGFVAGIICLLDRSAVMHHVPTGSARARTLLWSLFALGFLYLGFDEYAAVHEGIEDRFAAHVLHQTGGHAPGLVLPTIALTGILPALALVRMLRADRAALAWFLGACALSAFALTSDEFDFLDRLRWDWLDTARRIAEDSAELFAGGAFLLSFLRWMLVRLSAISPAR